MKIQEFRLVLPFSCKEYKVAQRYMVAKFSASESTGEGDGVEVLKNEPFENEELGKGQYTHKIYHLEQKLPNWLRRLLPKAALTLEEMAWNAFPRTKHIMRSPYFTKVYIAMESLHYDDDHGTMENAHNLNARDLKKRTIEFLDIAKDTPGPPGPEEDPSLFQSEKSGRGPLKGDWQASANPVMCAYKLVHVDFPYYGMGVVEKFVAHTAYRKLLLDGHRKMFCWIDEWTGKTMEDVLAMEGKIFAEMSDRVSSGRDVPRKLATDTASPESSASTVSFASVPSGSVAANSTSAAAMTLSASDKGPRISAAAAAAVAAEDNCLEDGSLKEGSHKDGSIKDGRTRSIRATVAPVATVTGALAPSAEIAAKSSQPRGSSETFALRVGPDTDATAEGRPDTGGAESAPMVGPLATPATIRVNARRTSPDLASPLYSPPPGNSPNRPPVHKGKPAGATHANGGGQATPTLWANRGGAQANGKPAELDVMVSTKGPGEVAVVPDAGGVSAAGGALSALSGYFTRMISSSDLSGAQAAAGGAQGTAGVVPARGGTTSRGNSFTSRSPAPSIRGVGGGAAVGMSEAVLRAVESLDAMIHAIQQQQQQQAQQQAQ